MKSLWLDRFPRNRRPSYPRLRGDVSARVAIVGGGLTGASCALSFAAAGLDVVLLEAEAIGTGATAAAPGVLHEGFAGGFRSPAEAHGLRVARAAWDLLRRGSLDFAAALRRYGVRCDLAPSEILTFGAAADARLLRREYDLRHDASIEGGWINAAAFTRETAAEGGGAIRTRGFVIDPYRACVGLVEAAAARGARIHERSKAGRIRATKQSVQISTEGGTVTADTVIVATGAPLADLRPLRRHLRVLHGYGVVTEPLPAPMRRQVGKRAAVLEDAAEPWRTVRWLRDDRVLIVGGRQDAVAERFRPRAVLQRTGQLMYEFSLLYPAISGLQPKQSWDFVDYETVDGLPFAGPHRNFPRHLFAFSGSRQGAGVSWAAARLLLRHFLGESTRGDEALGFHRIL